MNKINQINQSNQPIAFQVTAKSVQYAHAPIDLALYTAARRLWVNHIWL
jgi:hypothetical protein